MESQVDPPFSLVPLTNLVCSVNASSMFLGFWRNADSSGLIFGFTFCHKNFVNVPLIYHNYNGRCCYCFRWFMMKWRKFLQNWIPSLIGNEYKFLSSSDTIDSINVDKIFFLIISSSGLSHVFIWVTVPIYMQFSVYKCSTCCLLVNSVFQFSQTNFLLYH